MNDGLSRYEALIACRDKAGSDTQMGRDLGITQPTMWRIINQTKQLPDVHVLPAERLYGVSRHDLRPDLYPRESCVCSACCEAMVDRAAGLRFQGIDRRARSRADRRVIAERYASGG